MKSRTFIPYVGEMEDELESVDPTIFKAMTKRINVPKTSVIILNIPPGEKSWFQKWWEEHNKK